MCIAFSATNEVASTAETTSIAEITDLAETTNLAALFDFCQLSPIQQLFLCYQAAKYQDLSYRLNFAHYTYKKCYAAFSDFPKFLLFPCPPITSSNTAGKPAIGPKISIYLSGSDQPAMALVFTPNWRDNLSINVKAWMESIDIANFKKVEEEPSMFGLDNVDVLISES